jgi:hypothetical protein
METDPMSFEFDELETCNATRPSTDPTANPARKSDLEIA